MIAALVQPPRLRVLSYAHSAIYCVLIWFAFVDRHESVVSVFGWLHGFGWIGMSLLCIEAVRRRTIPLWLGVMVAVVGGVGPFAGSIGFIVLKRRADNRGVAHAAPSTR